MHLNYRIQNTFKCLKYVFEICVFRILSSTPYDLIIQRNLTAATLNLLTETVHMTLQIICNHAVLHEICR